MTTRLSVPPAPVPLEAYAQQFDPLFGKDNQRDGFRRYLEGVLLPTERHKTLTALVNAEPIMGAQEARVQSLQWFLSEATWDASALNARRLELVRADPTTAPDGRGVLVIDEHGDRKWGTKTAHVGKQYLGNLGKVDNGVVSVTSLWADERVYQPIEVEPYTPAHHFPQRQADPQFRTKLQIAIELVDRARQLRLPFRAVVADAFYGKELSVQEGLEQLGVGYVLAVPPSSGWWHRAGTIGSLDAAARAAGWQDAAQPGRWVPVERHFRDGHTETWWALEVGAGPYGPTKPQRAVVATTDPGTLPERTTWYLVTNLPAPDTARARASDHAPADLAELVRLFGLRVWVEQSYKQAKVSLGWSDYQVRSDRAIRRHWALVWCAFSFCWHHVPAVLGADAPTEPEPPAAAAPTGVAASGTPAAVEVAGRGKKSAAPAADAAPTMLVASCLAGGAGVAGALAHAVALLERVVIAAPTAPTAASPR